MTTSTKPPTCPTCGAIIVSKSLAKRLAVQAPETDAARKLREAHRARVNLILSYIDPPEQGREANIRLQQAIDSAVEAARREGRRDGHSLNCTCKEESPGYYSVFDKRCLAFWEHGRASFRPRRG